MTKRILFKILAIFVWTLRMPNVALSQDAKHSLQILAKVQPISDSTKLDIDFDALDLQGNPFKGLALQGKFVFLDFWAVWCAPCITAFPTLKKMNTDFKDKEFELVGIAVYSGTVEDINKFVEKHKLDYKIVIDDAELAERFKVIGVPSYFLLGRDGSIYKKYIGEVAEFYDELRKDIYFLSKKSE